MLKRIATSLFCLFLIFASIPFLGNTYFLCSSVYADSDLPTGYTPANTNTDLASSFNDYVKSRNANFNGTLPDATEIYILNLMNKGAQRLDTNLDTIKNNLAKKSDTAGQVIWYLDSTVTNFYNRLFDFLLQDMELAVGDTANEQVYSGMTFTDNDGITCLVYVFSNGNFGIYEPNIQLYGTDYKFSSNDLVTLVGTGSYNPVFHLNQSESYSSKTYTYYANGWANNGNITDNTGNSFGTYVMLRWSDGVTKYGKPIIKYNSTNQHLTLTWLQESSIKSSNGLVAYDLKNISRSASNVQNATINFVTIDNKTINNNNYEGDTYITNEGDVINNITPGGKDPGWDVGGGQGSYEDNSGNSYTINFPDFELPDLNIDWSIQGLGNKFPFSIPFDIVSLVTVLNAEPEAPRFQGTVNFGFTTWNYDINLQQFDSVAQVCRIAELLLLVFGLILITRSIIKG